MRVQLCARRCDFFVLIFRHRTHDGVDDNDDVGRGEVAAGEKKRKKKKKEASQADGRQQLSCVDDGNNGLRAQHPIFFAQTAGQPHDDENAESDFILHAVQSHYYFSIIIIYEYVCVYVYRYNNIRDSSEFHDIFVL